ncbi:uncharacterized protein LOC144692693 [Cetorhinus maximus]
MAESGVSPNGQLPRSHDQRGIVGSAPHKGKRAANSASEPETNVSLEFSKNYPALCQWMPGPNVSVLQPNQRVRRANMSAGRAAVRQPESRGCPDPGKPGECTPSEECPPSGDGQRDRRQEGELHPCLQKRTYLTDRILNCEEGPLDGGKGTLRKCTKQGMSRGAAGLANAENAPWLIGEKPQKSNAKNWSPPKGFWKVLGTESGASHDRGDTFDNEILQKETWNANGSEHPNADYGNGPGQRGPSEELLGAESFDISTLRYGEWTAEKWNAHKPGHLEGLWRTDSWESVSSNASLLSLTERVELNRSILKWTLRPAHLQPGPGVESLPQQKLTAPHCQFQPNLLDDILPGKACIKQGCGTVQSDSDWDSGISLQEPDCGMRVFVSSSQLPLSRRHEQAKRLLERARMKARASPLKADHSILPIERNPLEASTDSTSSPKRGPFSRDGPSSNARNSGYLSDSSSGESHCGLRKKRSQSPSRVRFEDESTQEAEVRYQLRRKCGTEYSAHHGPKVLMPRPGLPAYGLPGKEGLPKASSGDGSKTYCKNRQGRGTWRSGGNPITNGEKPPDKTNISHINTAICIDGKCSSCGSHIISDSKSGSFAPPSYTFPDIRTVPQEKELYLPKWHELPLDTATRVKTNLTVEAGDVGSLSTRAVPCWVLPSEHRIRTEPIRETYIGDVTSIDDISVVDGEEVAISCQDNATEVNDREGATVSAYCYAIVSGSNMRTTDGLKLNAKDIDWPRRGTGEKSVAFEPASATADCKSKSRRKTMDGRGVCTQQVQCQRKELVNSSQELRNSADPKPVISMSKDSHVASPGSERVTETSPDLLQPTPQSPSPTSDQSSKQSRERVTVHSSPVPRKRGTRSLGSGQVKEIPPSLHSQNRSRVLNSHPTDPTLPSQFMNKTSCQHPLLKRPLINRANLTIPSTSQQSGVPLTLKSQPATHLSTCSSPQYRLVHLDPPGNDGSLPNSQAVLETSSLQPQQPMPNDHILALHTSDPSAHCLSSSAIRLPKDTVTIGCSSQSLGNYRSEVGMRSSQVANQFTDASGGLSRPEHHDSVEPTKNRNCLTSASAEQSAETNNKTEPWAEFYGPIAVRMSLDFDGIIKSSAVKFRPRDSIHSF